MNDKRKQIVHSLVNNMIDNFLFDSILDYFKINYGFPGASSIYETISTSEVISPILLNNNEPNDKKFVICKSCQKKVSFDDYFQHIMLHSNT